MGMTCTNLLIHLVFATRHRAPALTPAIEGRLHPYLTGLLQRQSVAVLAIGGIEDHVHLLVRLPPGKSLAAVVRHAKSTSSAWLNRTGLLDSTFAWQTGYGAFSVSASAAPTVLRYIRNQPIHHRRSSYRKELIALLVRHGIRYEDRYLLD